MSGTRDRRAVAVRIAGHEYKIRSDGDEEGLVRIAGYVDQAMERVRAKTGTVDSLDVAVLTCLNLAREILALHGQRSGAVPDEKLRSLIERVEAVVGISDEARGERVEAVEVPQAGAIPVGEATPQMPPQTHHTTQRTLELPSVEALRDRIPTGGSSDGLADHEHAPQVRAAAGGRDRVG